VRKRARRCSVVDFIPTGDVEDGPCAADVVLDADVEVGTSGIENATCPFCSQVVQRGDANASICQQILILTIGQAVPQVVVVRRLERCLGVLVENRVAGLGLEGDVVRHVDALAGSANAERLHFGRSCVGNRLRDRSVSDADCLAVEMIGFVTSGVRAESHIAVCQGDGVDISILEAVLASDSGRYCLEFDVGVVDMGQRKPLSESEFAGLAVVAAEADPQGEEIARRVWRLRQVH